MAYDSVRKQLDQLLGPDRNGPIDSGQTRKLTFDDDRVCKNFLLGLCPHDLPIKRRGESGPCPQEHSEDLREEFQRVDAQGYIPDKVRWLRILHSECRGIVQDEDRRIRSHARRLQDIYKTNGFTGLMVKSFETLRALGMVSLTANPDAPGSEDDDASSEGPNAGEKIEENSEKAQRDFDIVAPKSVIQDSLPNSQAGAGQSKNIKADDEFEEFGEVKVIPDKKKSKVNEIDVGYKQGLEKRQDPNLAKPNSNSSFAGRVGSPAQSASSSESCPPSAGNKVQNALDSSSPPSSPEHERRRTNAYSSEEEGEIEREAKTLAATTGDRAADKIALDTEGRFSAQTAKDSRSTLQNPINNPGNQDDSQTKLEKFYAAGIGPDGLLMLDKKNNLRVCASCGGYISLFDAESRLMSHYRGKTHKSMDLLRAKLADIDAQINIEQRKSMADSRRPDFNRERRYSGWGRSGYRGHTWLASEQRDAQLDRQYSRKRSRSPSRDEFGRAQSHYLPRQHREQVRSRSRSPSERPHSFYQRSSNVRARRRSDTYDERRYSRSRQYSPHRGQRSRHH